MKLAYKLCFEMKMTKVYSKNLLMKSSKNNSIFLLVFSLIMCFMKTPKNFGKIAILKIWELISLRGLKTHFGKLALKWCIFRHEKKCFKWYYFIAFDPIKSWTLKASQSDGLNLSFVKDLNVVAKEMARNGHEMAIYESSFYHKIENKRKWKKLNLCCSFWSNKDFDMLGPLKWPSEPQVCESY